MSGCHSDRRTILLSQNHLVIDLLALAQADALAKLLGSEADVNGGDLLIISEHAALLHEAALAASGATLTARSGEQCLTCPVRDSCPIQPEGRRAVA